MNNHFLFLCLALITIYTAGAQRPQLGLRVGASVADVNLTSNSEEVDTKSRTNLQVGLLVDLPLALNLSVQAEINYVARGFNQDDINIGGLTVIEGDQTSLAYLDVGALLKLHFGAQRPISGYVGIGPFYNYALSGQIETDNSSTGSEIDINFDDDDGFNRSDFSIVPAVGIVFGEGIRFLLDVRYVLGLADYSDLPNTEIRNRSVGITGGIMVPLN